MKSFNVFSRMMLSVLAIGLLTFCAGPGKNTTKKVYVDDDINFPNGDDTAAGDDDTAPPDDDAAADDDIDDDADDDDDDTQTDDDDSQGADDDTTGLGEWFDPTSGLIWQVWPTDSSWGGAVNYCIDLTLGGHTDWHLPTINELRSLVRGCDDTYTGGFCAVTSTCLDSTCETSGCFGCNSGMGPVLGCYWPLQIRGDCQMRYWSSSSLGDYFDFAWYIDFWSATLSNDSKDDYFNYFRCVR